MVIFDQHSIYENWEISEIFGNYQIAYRQINDQGMNFNLIHFVIVQFKTFWTIKKPQITAFDRVQPHKCQYGHE